MSPVDVAEHDSSTSQQPAEGPVSAKQDAGAVGAGAPAPTPPPSQEPKVQPFRFQDLPRELRDKVYVLAIPEESNTVMKNIGVGIIKSKSKHFRPKQYTIVQVSRTMRREALAAYFASLTFRIQLSRHGDTAGRAWVEDQEDLAIRSMRKVKFVHHSLVDHGEEKHLASIDVDIVKGTVELEADHSTCDECGGFQVVPKVVEKLQAMVKDIAAEDGRKRFTRESLGEMVSVASHMCRPRGDEAIPEWMALQ